MYTSFPLPCECARCGLGSNEAARKKAGVLAGASTPMRSRRLRGVPQPAAGREGLRHPRAPAFFLPTPGSPELPCR